MLTGRFVAIQDNVHIEIDKETAVSSAVKWERNGNQLQPLCLSSSSGTGKIEIEKSEIEIDGWWWVMEKNVFL